MDEQTIETLEKRLGEIDRRFAALETELAEPGLAADQDRYRKVTRQHAELQPVVAGSAEWKRLRAERADAAEMLRHERDPEMRAFAQATQDEADAKLPDLLTKIRLLLLPKDPLDEKNVILEIRAGTGGEEAALFAGDLYRMYMRFAETQRWRCELMERNEAERGGLKEVIVSIEGENVYSRLKWESGVHRVQRVPETEASGRIHTSAATVAVLPAAEEVDVKIEAKDLLIDVYRSQGPGGQSVNTTDSAVRITHKPTGLVVTCQDEKSQHKNKAKALRVLRSRLFDLEVAKQAEERAGARRQMVGSGDRSERIRTYNFPQNRLTDHRIDLTLYSLDRIIEGDLGDLIDALILENQTRQLADTGE